MVHFIVSLANAHSSPYGRLRKIHSCCYETVIHFLMFKLMMQRKCVPHCAVIQEWSWDRLKSITVQVTKTRRRMSSCLVHSRTVSPVPIDSDVWGLVAKKFTNSMIFVHQTVATNILVACCIKSLINDCTNADVHANLISFYLVCLSPTKPGAIGLFHFLV